MSAKRFVFATLLCLIPLVYVCGQERAEYNTLRMKAMRNEMVLTAISFVFQPVMFLYSFITRLFLNFNTIPTVPCIQISWLTASYGMTDTMGRMHSDAQFAGSSSVPAHVEMMGFLGI